MTIEEAIASQDPESPARTSTPAEVERLQHENHRLIHRLDELTVELALSERRRYRHIKRFLLKRRQYRVALQNIMAAEQTVKWMRRAEYLMRHLQRLKQIKDVTQIERDGARSMVKALRHYEQDCVVGAAYDFIIRSWDQKWPRP